MNLRTSLIAVVLLAFGLGSAEAAVKRQWLDQKMPTQAMLEHETLTTPLAATTNYIKTTYAGPTSAAALTLSSFTHQPDVPRNITVTPTGTTGDVESCVITISGTNYYDHAITDTVTFAADASTVQATTKAFKSVTSVAWPASCESGGFGATWIIGVGEVFGLSHCLASKGDVAWASLGGTYEGTRPTCLSDSTHVESNTCDINGSPDGTKNVEFYFVQNFNCTN